MNEVTSNDAQPDAAIKQQKRIVIVGASAAGMKAACRARRLLPEAEITVIEAGEYISYAACGMPFFLSGDIQNFDDLRRTPYGLIKDSEYFRTVKDVSVRINVIATAIDREKSELVCVENGINKEFAIPYDNLVIATGARPVIPDIPGNDHPGVFTFTRAEDAIALRSDCEKGKISRVAVIGAGYIGIELCESFSALWGIDVTLFEAEEHILPGMLDREIADYVESYLEGEGITIVTGARCQAIKESESGLVIQTSKGEHPAAFDRVMFCLGVRPDSDLVKEAHLETGKNGGIIVNEYLQTSDPVIYAGGDCVALRHRLLDKPVIISLGSLANRMGRAIGDTLGGKKRPFGPVLGTSILKAFDCNIASVGLNAKHAREAGYTVGETWGVFDDNAEYYPGGEKVFTKLVFDIQTEKVLGVQAAGNSDVMRRIDSASALMQNDATLTDLMNFEPAYSPPYANPIDPLHYLAYIAEGIIQDSIGEVPPQTLQKLEKDNLAVLDVRNDSEREEFPLPAGNYEQYHIPIERLRSQFNEVPRDRPVAAICQRGPRSYEAEKILKTHGYENVSFIGGGMLFARICKSV